MFDSIQHDLVPDPALVPNVSIDDLKQMKVGNAVSLPLTQSVSYSRHSQPFYCLRSLQDEKIPFSTIADVP